MKKKKKKKEKERKLETDRGFALPLASIFLFTSVLAVIDRLAFFSRNPHDRIRFKFFLTAEIPR